MENAINAHCLENHIKNISDFFRYALVNTLTPDIKDKTLIFESLKQMHDKLHSIEQGQELLYKLSIAQFKNMLVYHDEIRESEKKQATVSANERFDKFMKFFSDALKEMPAMMESLLADFVEEKVEQL
jgi:hypothetical protein